MHIYATEPWNGKQPGGQNLSISRDYARVGFCGLESSAHFFVCFDLCGLMDGDSMRERKRLHGRLVHMFASAGRFVWLGEYSLDVVAVGDQPG